MGDVKAGSAVAVQELAQKIAAGRITRLKSFMSERNEFTAAEIAALIAAAVGPLVEVADEAVRDHQQINKMLRDTARRLEKELERWRSQ